ncbi:MAG TPA: CdaR family protein [Candidatus Binataceae bacterium]|nr:CdaR family protein [Candidatus Binataceae bacterium]
MATAERKSRSASRSIRGGTIGNAVTLIFSIVIAIGLWVFVNAAERDSVESFRVQISYATLPTGMVIVNRPPDFVEIDVSGPRMLLSLLDPARLAVKLDLNRVATGQSEFKIYPSMFNVKRAIVTRISPDQITLDIDRIISRDLPVHLAVEGKVAPGYKITSIATVPPSISAVGPSRQVSDLARAVTEPFDVSGLTANVERNVDLAPPPAAGWVRFSASQVVARVEVAQEVAEREFRAVDIDVRDSDYKFRIDPKQGSVTIRGPAAKLNAVSPAGLLYVDAKGDVPGLHELPLKVNLPDGMRVVRLSPDKVKLRTYREKLKARTDGHAS